MFAFLRRLIVPIMITVLVFFLATIVFEWGMNVSSSRRVKDTVGRINNQDIQLKTYDNYYTTLLRQEQEKVDYDLPADKLEEIRTQAWNRLVGDYLVNSEIEKQKIIVTDQEIYGFLRLYPPQELQTASQFMTDGKFDYQKYVSAMVNPQLSTFWASVEQLVIPDLKRYKLQEGIINTARVSPAEVLDAFLEDRDSVKIGYIAFLNSKAMSSVAQPTIEEMKQYYDEHRENYKQPKRAKLDIVLFKKDPSQNDWDKIGYRIRELYDSVMAGADFAELARTYSEDNSASGGGDLGWFGHKQMVSEFDSVVWSLNINQVSRPFKTRFGWHIVKLLGKKVEKEKAPGSANEVDVEKANAAHILLNITASQETLDQLQLDAKDFAALATESGFEKAAKDKNYQIMSTSPFAEKGYIQYLGNDQSAQDFAFNNEPGKVSEELENNSSYYVLKMAAHLPEGYSAFEEVKASINQDIINERAKQATLSTAQRTYEAIKSGTPITRAGETYGASYAETEMINRKTAIPNMGRPPEVFGAAFALKYIGEVSLPIQFTNGTVILTLLGRKSPNLEEFNRIQDSLSVVVLQKKQQDLYSRWFDNLLKNTKIENYVNEVYGKSY
jgi:peptidyl-prolyl cis-trans isomerase D